jgi:hypothetical protein
MTINRKNWIRWLLTLLLGAASLYFMYSGLVTGVIAEGGRLSVAYPQWAYQAKLRASLAILIWFAAVSVFLLLRPGGFKSILLSGQLSAHKRWIYVITFVLSALALLLTITEFVRR